MSAMKRIEKRKARIRSGLRYFGISLEAATLVDLRCIEVDAIPADCGRFILSGAFRS